MEKLRGPIREYQKQQVAASHLRKSDTSFSPLYKLKSWHFHG